MKKNLNENLENSTVRHEKSKIDQIAARLYYRLHV